MMRKSISCMLGGLLFSTGLYMVLFAAAYDWHPGKPMLVFWVAMTFLIVGGLWLWDEIREMLAAAPSPKKYYDIDGSGPGFTAEEIEKRLLR
jgi:hypothetical protein